MLNSNQKKKLSSIASALIVSLLFIISSCMPTSSGPSINAAKTTEGPSTKAPSPEFPDPSFPLPGIFVQEAAIRSTTNFSLPLDFKDSFLLRGAPLSKFLKGIPNTTKFCLVGKYNYLPGEDRFLIMAAKPKSFTDLAAKTTEFFLQVEPSNDTANQNDCLGYNLTNALFATSTKPSAHFSLTQLCSTCTTTVTSMGLMLYFVNGEQVPNMAVGSLNLTISGASSETSSSCSESTLCKANGYDCCLNSVCVKDGALRPGALNLPGFDAAQEDVKLNPNRFVVYPQYYYVCESRPDSTGTTVPAPQDPEYEAAVRLMELKQLYSCLNKVDGELSHCTLKYPNASASMPGEFSASKDGFKDDITFSSLNPYLGSGDKGNNILKIIYGGNTVYEQDKVPLTGGTFVAGTQNDDLSTAQAVNLNLTLPSNAKDANLYITYKVDGTCERISSTLARCQKTYVQGSSDIFSTTWHDSSKFYRLPPYADTSPTASMIVKVSGMVVPEDPSTWSKSSGGISFAGSYPLYQNQVVEISYFTKPGSIDILKLRTAVQEKVNSMCSCSASSKCNLKPLYDTTNTNIVNFECTYPAPAATEPPANQTVYVSNKNTPHRYFDLNGVGYDENYGTALDQELNAFKYTNNDLLKPNNVTSYVGFNEIYGSFAKSGMYIARPAKMVRVKKDTLYDVLVNSGVFSSCLSCGSDYYTTLQKLFPQNFGSHGGGYAPDNFETRRENSKSTYRSDDLLFGRACFVPATMIPWTHVSSSSPAEQRRNRLAAQHFLFANGYNRDWYGFDYGSLIGSFDGVKWFSIGSQRRIKATSNRMFLAVNAYLGDLNVDSNFNVTVSESSAFSSEIPDHDTESEGAQCQQSHFCANDNDCFRQLGYDYTCQNVSSITTPWPHFDANGSEISGATVRTLLSVVGGSNGKSKRCVYRGRGTPCLQDLSQAATATTFNGSSSVGTLMCSPNNSCLPLSTSSRFNDRIARFGNSPVSQNVVPVVTPLSDTVGLGARLILRPFDYYGTQSTPVTVRSALTTNNVFSICVPGKESPIGGDNLGLNSRHPVSRVDSSDKLYGVGRTTATVSMTSLNACPATDDQGMTTQLYDLPLGHPNLNKFTVAQNLSSNLLDLQPLRNQRIFSSTNGSQVASIGYQRNTCLRAPGATCFSDLECAPSGIIASRAKLANLATILNTAEAKFWEEDLVCGNPEFKHVAVGVINPDFDIKKNKCCREFGKTMTVYTQMSFTSPFEWCDSGGNIKVAGMNMDYSSPTRYSRLHSVYDKLTCNRNDTDAGKTFALSLAANNATERMTQLLKGQYKTLDTLNSRVCCTNHWVRSFSTENGGGHAFEKAKTQNIDKAMFKHLSWLPPSTIITGVDNNNFECDKDNWGNASCEIKNFTQAEEDKYLNWAGTLELVGIPQVAIPTTDQIFKLVGETPSGGQAPVAPNTPLTDTDGAAIMQVSSPSNSDFTDTNLHYSGVSYLKLNMGTGTGNNKMKKVFSEDEFNCCIPAGQEVPETVTPGQCCTGLVANTTDTRKCCLPDFADVSVYLNRYVSSEGRGLPDSAYDPKTGYIKDPGQVQLLAAQRNLCCSGKTELGVAISNLPIPLTDGTMNPNARTRRFNYRTDDIDEPANSEFDAGLRWNNHVYCMP